MTHNEKAELLKDTISQLYEKEGRSIKYISSTLNIDRKVLSKRIKEWNFVKANVKHLKPSQKKFLNTNKQVILDSLNSDVFITNIVSRLNIDRKKLITYIKIDKELKHTYELYHQRRKNKANIKFENFINASIHNYNYETIEGEIWSDVLGYPKYQVSNMGRFRKYVKTHKTYHLLKLNYNIRSNRVYVSFTNENGNKKNLSVPRLVGFAFVKGYSDINNTINHINGDTHDNKATNLEWVSQAENNKKAYITGRAINIRYQRNGKYKKIILDGKYEFKTFVALSKFLHKSETQVRRYIDGECETEHTFEFVY